MPSISPTKPSPTTSAIKKRNSPVKETIAAFESAISPATPPLSAASPLLQRKQSKVVDGSKLVLNARLTRFRDSLVCNYDCLAIDLPLKLLSLLLTPLMMFFVFVQDHLLFRFLNRIYIYNVSFEDPRMDVRELKLDSSDHIITIASAGCNALDFIIEGARVTAVDFNSCQIALCELKKAAFLELAWEEVFDIFGRNNIALLRAVYPVSLRKHLSGESVEFWDRSINSITSFMYSGSSGLLAYIVARVAMPAVGLGFLREEIVKGSSWQALVERASQYGWRLRSLAWIIDNLFIPLCAVLGGTPERQLRLGLWRRNTMATVFQSLLFKSDLASDNYLFAGYLLGYYTPEVCPRYLQRQHFETIRKCLRAGNLRLIHGSLVSAMDASTETFTAASLLDHMDWMSETEINEELRHLLAKMDLPRGRIFWRTFASEVHSAPLLWLKPRQVDDSDDRCPSYWSTWIAHTEGLNVAYPERVLRPQSLGLIRDVLTGVQVVTFPALQPLLKLLSKSQSTHGTAMEAFYRYQREGYDSFREGMLHARPILMESIPLSLKDRAVWVDIGGGTARNLEFFTPDVLRRHFSRILIVDISPSLLEVARRRILEMGIADIADCIEMDCTGNDWKSIIDAGTVDLVTASYSLSMIPDQRAALRNINDMLKPGSGLFAVADFFASGMHESALSPTEGLLRALETWAHRTWFSFDGVHLLEDEKMGNLLSGLPLRQVWDSRFRGSVPFIPGFRPFHGVQIYGR